MRASSLAAAGGVSTAGSGSVAGISHASLTFSATASDWASGSVVAGISHPSLMFSTTASDWISGSSERWASAGISAVRFTQGGCGRCVDRGLP